MFMAMLVSLQCALCHDPQLVPSIPCAAIRSLHLYVNPPSPAAGLDIQQGRRSPDHWAALLSAAGACGGHGPCRNHVTKKMRSTRHSSTTCACRVRAESEACGRPPASAGRAAQHMLSHGTAQLSEARVCRSVRWLSAETPTGNPTAAELMQQQLTACAHKKPTRVVLDFGQDEEHKWPKTSRGASSQSAISSAVQLENEITQGVLRTCIMTSYSLWCST